MGWLIHALNKIVGQWLLTLCRWRVNISENWKLITYQSPLCH